MKTITGYINESGKFEPDSPELFKQAFKSFAGAFIRLELYKLPKRSNPLNRYYWGVVIPMIAQCLQEASGEPISADDAHEFCKLKFNARTVATEAGFEIIPKSTTGLSNSDFIDYLERIKQFAAEYFGVYIPEPNEEVKPFD